MDSFTLVVFLIMIMIAISQEVLWAAAGLIVLLVFSLRSSGLIVIAVVAIALGFMFQNITQLIWIMLSMLILAVFILKQGKRGPEMYSPEALMGGY